MTIVLKNHLERHKANKTDLLKTMILAGSLIFALLGVSTLEAQTTIQDAKSLFSLAQANFELGLKQKGEQKRALMIKAAGQFRSLIQDHQIENGYLYFNMGNANYEAGEIGKAILSYRQAEKHLPGFADLQYNLDQARSRLNLYVPEIGWWDKMVRGLAFWHYMMAYEMRRVIFFVVFALFWVVLAGMIFRRHVFLRMGLIILFMLNLGFGGSYLYSTYQFNFIKAGVVVTNSTPARKGPGSSYESFYQKPLLGGTEFVILEKRENWWKVRLHAGDEVWIKGNDAGVI
jgi:tetratricopeptide (TPR) repeat protein